MDTTAAIQAAATAVRAHQTSPDTVTLRDMQDKVQQAQNQGASLQDIANANR
ncbi:hypothetical protein OV320_2660 [Actinobacteria bacterium OV320]|jgi:hypothetical protein|nr:hypothetical protein OV320_2660 [Actinobacteria bacterium OV320]